MSSPKPKVLLFDIGGVIVASPFAAILAYETRNSIPHGWINHSISHSGAQGSWAQLERGETSLSPTFFSTFKSDLSNEKLWRQYYISHLRKTRGESGAQAAEETLFLAPPVPDIDAEVLFWEMMEVSRAPDKKMWTALRKLKTLAQGEKGFVLAALSNTVVFPDGHAYTLPNTASGRFAAELRDTFDVFVSSALVGMRKPEKRIYEFALGEVGRVATERGLGGVEPRDVLFFDDIGANLRAAREVGMRTFKVVLGRTGEAVEELERALGVRLSGEEAKL